MRNSYVARHFWQFRNGKLALVSLRDLIALHHFHYVAWDRSLGAWVMYQR